MKRIVIISYFFPPCNLTAAQRIKGWAKYLNEFGYYPTIITRNWDIKISSPSDVLRSAGDEVRHVKNEGYEVFFLPYKSSLRDKVFINSEKNKMLSILSKVLTFRELVFENFSNKFISYSNILKFTEQLFIENPSIYKGVIISGNPFNQFKFGYELSRKYKINWIADYRDDWTTSELNSKVNFINKSIHFLHAKSEKKWVSTAKVLTSISVGYVNKISSLVKIPGHVILNGYDNIDTKKIELPKNAFSITYNGSLYSTQPIESVLNSFIALINDDEIKIDLKFNFPGLAFDKTQEKRVKEIIKDYEENFIITNRVPKEEVLIIQKQSDLLLMVSHKGIKGIPSSKLYEYIGLQKRVLLFPNDHDIIEETLNDVGNGIICDYQEMIFDNLKELILLKQNGNLNDLELDQSKVEFYSRKNQTKVLAELMDKVF